MRWQEQVSDGQLDDVETEIWNTVRDSIETGAILAVSRAARRIAAASAAVPETEIVDILVLAATSARVPVEIDPSEQTAPRRLSTQPKPPVRR